MSFNPCAEPVSPIANVNRHRRLVLGACGGLLVAPWLHAAGQNPRSWGGADPFCLGVAAGDPREDGFVLWTRLAPDPLSTERGRPGGMSGPSLPVAYDIASDETMRSIVRLGTALAEAGLAYSVHVEVHGLAPGRPYWYRFRCGDAVSRIGQAHTLPRAVDTPRTLRIASVSCANYEHGYFAAYRHLLADRPDFVLFLGDYLYEYVDRRNRTVRTHSDNRAATTLPGYRNRHAQYRLDPDLQALHAGVTSLITWDDHEVQDNYAGAWSKDFVDPRRFALRRAAAYQAFYEHMPLRPSRGLPAGPALPIFGNYRFGDLAGISMIDARQYRSAPSCPRPETAYSFSRQTDAMCPERLLPARTMLGAVQEDWLFKSLSASQARWNFIAQSVQMAQTRSVVGDGQSAFGQDNWDGYPAARTRLLNHLARRKVANPVVLSGDIHAYCAADLKVDFDDPRAAVVGTEFVTSSISALRGWGEPGRRHYANNPHIRFQDGRQRGYVLCDIDRRELRTRLRAVSDARDPLADVATLKTFIVENGRPGAHNQE